VALIAADFKAAQVDFVPLSLRDVPLQKSTVEWADIGGAENFDETRFDMLTVI
jgi:peroxin-1